MHSAGVYRNPIKYFIEFMQKPLLCCNDSNYFKHLVTQSLRTDAKFERVLPLVVRKVKGIILFPVATSESGHLFVEFSKGLLKGQ